MKPIRLLPFVAVVLLVSPVLLADGLLKYKNWPNSPQGYFMTRAERADWQATVKTDADAETFVKNFLAKRPAGFADEVAKNAQMADKYLSLAGQAGSLTTRGKIIIVLGPPSTFNVSQAQDVRKDRSHSMNSYMSAAGGTGQGGSPGVSADDMVDARNRAEMGGADVTKYYSFTYAPDKLPVKSGKDFAVVVQVNSDGGREHVTDRKTAEQLDDLLEAAAQAKLTPAKQ